MIHHRPPGSPLMPDLLESTENGITTLTLNRPERLNALSPAMTAGIRETLERLSTDNSVGAIVIAGAGRGWCAGRDVADDELHTETMALAARIADGPRVALGYMKRNLLAAETEDFQTVLDLEAEHQARCAFTEDHKEAVAAFNEKRRPVFRGR